jgi:hypothetical protein
MAWSYLGVVVAAVVGGLVALVVYQVARPMVCPAVVDDVADLAVTCELVWTAGLAMAGFLAAYAGALRLLKVERWLGAWLGTFAGLVGLLMLMGYVFEWWWWLALLLLPAAAAVASAPWSNRPVVRRVQLGGLGLVAAVALGVFVVGVLLG